MRHNILSILAILISASLISTPLAYSQREKNNIYLFDCTGSMKTNSLWEPAKASLDATISTQIVNPGSQYCVIPFGDSPYLDINFESDSYSSKKKEINDAFDKYIAQAKYTRISDVLDAGFKKVDPHKENRIYLLTDGMPNGGDTPDKVAQTIAQWCANHRNCRLFYVALTDNVINPIIQQAIDDCPDAYIVQCKDRVIPQITDISNHIYTNLQELNQPKEILFSDNATWHLNFNGVDSLFNVTIANNEARNGKISVSLTPNNGYDISQLHQILEGQDYTFDFDLQSADDRCIIANPTVTVHVADDIPSSLTIAGGVDELVAEGAHWFPAFLWSDACADKTITWDLQPVFKYATGSTTIAFEFNTSGSTGPDFQAWYNGEPIKNNSILVLRPEEPAVITLQFNHDANEGKYYFSLTPISVSEVDFINDIPLSDYTGISLRTNYSVGWNPLMTLLFWIGIILLGALILWLLVLKHIFFPTIKMAKVTITGPGAYYVSKRIKGARKVTLTSKRKSQNIISRIFTGEIRYIKSESFSPDISILPAAGKKKVKLRVDDPSRNAWDFYPSAIFNQYEKGSITNRTTKDKSEIEFS